MSKSVMNALKATAVLVCITVVCVGVLTLCNMFFPKYVPTLDAATAKLINSICPTGTTDEKAFDEDYIVILEEGDYGVKLDDFNKTNKLTKAEILAVYREQKGVHQNAFIVESKSTGRDGDVVILTAYLNDIILGATVKKQGESYWEKLPDDLFAELKGKPFEPIDLNGLVGKTGATLSLSAIERAVNLSNTFAKAIAANVHGYIVDVGGANE
ncbi:MAG: hypothetical protein HDT28_06545 [Clostridiales bacterium]|nr:hypothetical protein [Clostridiales bacterium]